ncbi:hypothetical protein D3C87_2067070 [compost metagenome]|jgi:hypothetical protein
MAFITYQIDRAACQCQQMIENPCRFDPKVCVFPLVKADIAISSRTTRAGDQLINPARTAFATV